MDGWDVNNNVALGFFSFTKFVMYNDLNPEAWEDNVDLTKNELIQAIFNPAKNDQESFREEDIDSRLEYQNMYLTQFLYTVLIIFSLQKYYNGM